MHVKHLGIDQYFCGSVLWLLCYIVLEDSASENLARVVLKAKEWWTANKYGDHFNNIKLSMFHDPAKPYEQFPKLKGRAAEIKNLVPALLHIWTAYSDPTDTLHKLISFGLRCSHRLDQIMHEHVKDDVLPPDTAREWKTCVFAFLACQTKLARSFNNDGFKLFNVTVKSHALAHIGLDAQKLNPRRGWCYAGEHMMHNQRVLASSCCRGNTAHQASSKMTQKYRFGMHLQMTPDSLRRGRLI